MAFFAVNQSDEENGCHTPTGSAFRYQLLTDADGDERKPAVLTIEFWIMIGTIITLSVLIFCTSLAMCHFAYYDPLELRSAKSGKLFGDMDSEHALWISVFCLMIGRVLFLWVGMILVLCCDEDENTDEEFELIVK